MSGCVASGPGNGIDGAELGSVATRSVPVFLTSGLANGVDRGVAQPPRTSAIAQPFAAEIKVARGDDMRFYERPESVDLRIVDNAGRIVEKAARAGKLRNEQMPRAERHLYCRYPSRRCLPSKAE